MPVTEYVQDEIILGREPIEDEGPFVMNAEQVNPEPIEDLDIDFANLRLEEPPPPPPQVDITNLSSSENFIPDAVIEEPEEVDVDITAEPSSENSIASTGGGDSSPISNSMSMADNDYINYHDLTGKKGLSRIMSFVDKSSPPEKGSYAYKPKNSAESLLPLKSENTAVRLRIYATLS
jgi:hypothetical protein